MAEEKQESIEEEIENKGRGKRILVWLVVAAVVAAVIAIPILVLKPASPSGASEDGLSLASLNISVVSLEADVLSLETKSATQAEDIANLNSEVNGITVQDWTATINTIQANIVSLQNQIDALPGWASNISSLFDDVAALTIELDDLAGNLTPTDWATVIAEIQSDIDDLEAAFAALPTTLPPCATVADLGSKYLEIDICGAGDYSVIVTLYGSSLALEEVRVIDMVDYDIVFEMLGVGNATLDLFVEKSASWVPTDTVILVIDEITGSISYASAFVG